MKEERLAQPTGKNEDPTRPNHGPTQVREAGELELWQEYNYHAMDINRKRKTRIIQILTLPSESGNNSNIYPPDTVTVHIKVFNGGLVTQREISLTELGLKRYPGGDWDPDRWLEKTKPKPAPNGKLRKVQRAMRRLLP